MLPLLIMMTGFWDLTDEMHKNKRCLWGGSFPYKVNGSYIEGATGDFIGVIGGKEVVYDFATMERQVYHLLGVLV